jgi:hypothetical protein
VAAFNLGRGDLGEPDPLQSRIKPLRSGDRIGVGARNGKQLSAFRRYREAQCARVIRQSLASVSGLVRNVVQTRPVHLRTSGEPRLRK